MLKSANTNAPNQQNQWCLEVLSEPARDEKRHQPPAKGNRALATFLITAKLKESVFFVDCAEFSVPKTPNVFGGSDAPPLSSNPTRAAAGPMTALPTPARAQSRTWEVCGADGTAESLLVPGTAGHARAACGAETAVSWAAQGRGATATSQRPARASQTRCEHD